MQDVAHLESIAVYGDGPAGEHRVDEVCDPSLTLVAELPGSGNAPHSEDDGGQVVEARVVTHVLVGDALGACVGAMEVDGSGFRAATKSRRGGFQTCVF